MPRRQEEGCETCQGVMSGALLQYSPPLGSIGLKLSPPEAISGVTLLLGTLLLFLVNGGPCSGKVPTVHKARSGCLPTWSEHTWHNFLSHQT